MRTLRVTNQLGLPQFHLIIERPRFNPAKNLVLFFGSQRTVSRHAPIFYGYADRAFCPRNLCVSGKSARSFRTSCCMTAADSAIRDDYVLHIGSK
jgi:hypothetical protein